MSFVEMNFANGGATAIGYEDGVLLGTQHFTSSASINVNTSSIANYKYIYFKANSPYSSAYSPIFKVATIRQMSSSNEKNRPIIGAFQNTSGYFSSIVTYNSDTNFTGWFETSSSWTSGDFSVYGIA